MKSGRPDYPALQTLVEQCLAETVPAGYRIDALDRTRGWAIVKTALEPGEWPTQEYNLWITTDLEMLVITFDNSDAGMGPSFLRSIVVPGPHPGRKGMLVAALGYVLTQPANQWGYT